MNASEKAVKQMLEEKGFSVFRNGWPDFLCLREGPKILPNVTGPYGRQIVEQRPGVMCVEVKTGKAGLSKAQRAVHRVLRAVRIPVFVMRPEDHETALRARHLPTSQELGALLDQAQLAEQRLAALRSELEELEAKIDEAVALLRESMTFVERRHRPWRCLNCDERRRLHRL